MSTTWWEGLPGMDFRVDPAGYRDMCDRAVAMVCASRLNRPEDYDPKRLGLGTLGRREKARAERLLQLLQPSAQQPGTSMDGYLRRLALCMTVEECAPGTAYKQIFDLFKIKYTFVNGAPVRV